MSVRKRNWKSPSGERKHGSSTTSTSRATATSRPSPRSATPTPITLLSGSPSVPGRTPPTARASRSPRPPSYGSKARGCWAGTGVDGGLPAGRRLHITPILGALRLSQLTVPVVRGFEDRLHRNGRSSAMVRRARRLLGGILQTRGSAASWPRTWSIRCARNGADARRRQRQAQSASTSDAGRVRAIVGSLDSAAGRQGRPLLTAIFTGLRASELRGLRWEDVDLKRCELHVRQRADRYNNFGKPKSKPASAPSRCRRCWSRHCASIASPRPRASLALSSPTARAASISAPASSPRASIRADRGRCR